MSSGCENFISIAFFFNPCLGDNVSFTYQGAYCEGVLTELIYDGNNDPTYMVNVTYCSDWTAISNSEQVQVSLSQLSPVEASS